MRSVLVLFLLVSAATALTGADRYAILHDRADGGSYPKLLVLRDNQAGIEAAVAPAAGGELCSLRVRHNAEWIETIARARDYSETSGWRGKAPLLWPATGRNIPKGADRGGQNFTYEWKGRMLPMPLHGFVRDMEWTEESHSFGELGAELILSAGDTPQTRAMYPFGFRLLTAYRLADGVLIIAYTVRADAENGEPMPFSIGNHITFRAPLLEGTKPEEMLMETPSSVEYIKADPGIPTGETKPCSLAKPVKLAALTHGTAISLGGYQGEVFMRYADPQGLAIRLSHRAASLPEPPVILFNLWGDPAAGMWSPEPWVGLQNSLNLRQGLVWLPPGESWEWTLRLEVER